MHPTTAEQNQTNEMTVHRTRGAPLGDPAGSILAYVDGKMAEKVVPHAIALSNALGAPVTLLDVLSVPQRLETPADPVVWSIKRRKASDALKRIAKNQKSALFDLSVAVAEGRLADQICRCARENKADLTILGILVNKAGSEWGYEDIAHKLVERISGDLLLIPSSLPVNAYVTYGRILVALDGSYRAESVLPLALRIAKANDAELVLAHVIPATELTETGPLEAEDHLLLESVAQRNERVARNYLERIRLRVMQLGLSTRSIVLRAGDVRSSLAKLVDDQHIDLLVMTSHGHTGRMDCSCGSVASYMLSHTTAPLLLALRPPLPNQSKNIRGIEFTRALGDRRIPMR
jgi:nucleotide-binding universal stress UspA family protein